MLVPHKLLFGLIEQQLRAVLIPAEPRASSSVPGCIPVAELLLAQVTAPSRTPCTQTLLGSWDRLCYWSWLCYQSWLADQRLSEEELWPTVVPEQVLHTQHPQQSPGQVMCCAPCAVSS